MTVYIYFMKEQIMNYDIGTPYDRNPARIAILAMRNKKNSTLIKLISASLFSTMMFGVALAAMQIL